MRRMSAALILAMLATVALAAPAAAVTSWRVAVLIYRAVDLDCQGRQITASLANVAHDPATIAQRFASTASSWSDGAASVSVTVIEAGTLTSASPLGDGCWPAPGNVAIPAGYDSIIVMYEHDAEGVPGMNPYGGLAYEGLVGGYTYATIVIPDGHQAWHWGNALPELATVHEWLHGVGGYYRASYPSIPGLHSSGDYGYTDDVAWHSDFMGGDIDGSLGLTAEIWATGSPTGGVVTAKPCRNASSQAKACR